MKKNYKGYFLLFFCAVLLCLSHEVYSASSSEFDEAWKSQIYTEDQWSLQLVTGPIFSPTVVASRSPVMSYWQTNFRLGWMLSTPKQEKSWCRGNYEAIFEFSNSWIYEGFGSYMAGITALIRYNFLQHGWKIIPYFQVGAGVVYNNAYKDLSQNTIGQAIEFTPQGSVGIRYLIEKNWSFDAEIIFHHISNAGLDERNRGINALGGFVGFTQFFDNLFGR